MRRLNYLAPALLLLIAGCASDPPEEAAAPPQPPPVVAAPAPAPPAPAPPADEVASAGTTPDAYAGDDSTADLLEHHRHHHHGGFISFVVMSLDTIGATPEQAPTILKIQSDIRAKIQPVHDAEKVVLNVLADGAAAGKINKAKLDQSITQLSAAAVGVHAAVTEALNQLHAVLTPGQRAALIGKVEANYDVWHRVNGPDDAADKNAHLTKLAADVGLTPDQVTKVRTALKTAMNGVTVYDPAEADAHLKAFGAAFSADAFDAKTLTTGGPANAHLATFGVTRTARFYQAVVPVLTAAQRPKVADALRKHANYKATQTGT